MQVKPCIWFRFSGFPLQWRGQDHNSCVWKAGVEVGWDGGLATRRAGATKPLPDVCCAQLLISPLPRCNAARPGLCWHTAASGTAVHGAAGGEGVRVCSETSQSIRVGCSRAGDTEGLCRWWHEKAHKRALSSVIRCGSAQAPSAVLAGEKFEIRFARSESKINKLHQLGSSSCLKQQVTAADEYFKVGEMN